jgi:mannose-6-phosphate isomerase
MGLTRITGEIADYPWGGEAALSNLLGLPGSGGVEAEWWLGTHPLRPSHTADGEPVSNWLSGFGLDEALPYLFKILAPHTPLSLQVHPSADQAEVGFRAEEESGVPLTAATRLFKDPFPKPELVVALAGPFHALAGIRPIEQTLDALEKIADDSAAIQNWMGRLRDHAPSEVISWLLEGGDDVDELVAELQARATADDTLSRLARHYPGDPGIAVAMMMNRVTLLPGEALFLDAGQLHAYLEGFAIELMAPSDNVLRGGLTPKHVDVPGLLAITHFDPVDPPRLEPVAQPGGGVVFHPDGHGFALGLIEGTEVSATPSHEGPVLVVCTDGEWSVAAGEQSLELTTGQAVLASGSHESLRLTGSGQLWWATGN